MRKPEIAKLTIGYARVSTDKQAVEGVSLAAQEAKIRAMAVVHASEIGELIVDAGESAKSTERPGLQRLLALVNSGHVDQVIIAKLDRLTRSVRDLADLLELFNKRKVSLISVAESLDTSSASGQLVLNIMTAVSEWERKAIGERTSVALQHKRSTRNVYTRLTPYGFERVEDKLVALPAEQEVIGRIHAMRAAGLSLRHICTALNAEGIRTKQDRNWHPQRISDILSNPLQRKAA